MARDEHRPEELYTGPIDLPGLRELAEAESEVDPPEITYDEQRYPARPRRLRPRDQLRRGGVRRRATDPRTANGTNPRYVEWLVNQSMLHDADVLAREVSGQPAMWRNPYARPDARRAIAATDVWFTAYPISLITRPGQSFLSALGEEQLWAAFERIGITAIHTGPVKRAGGIAGWVDTPSVDGHFDRISTQIDPTFGTDDQFRALCDAAEGHGGSIIDDIVPGHTGKGADFRLAEMGYKDYPGIYHMVEIQPEDWGLLPDVPDGVDSVNLDPATEHELAERGYIIGALQRVIFYTPGVKETNWSATTPVAGPDGVTRRWVYLHYFKQGQPSINWLDPTFAGMRLVIGDALQSLGELGTTALRLDANGFLGVEKSAEGLPAWSEGHPLSHAANHIIGGMVRKVGGFTFQELNLTMEDIRDTGAVGADLSYDFVGRPGYHHALATGQTEFLRLALTTSLELGVEPVQLVHGLQNHDELTYELVHWATRHADDEYRFRGAEITGGDLAELVRAELTESLTGTADYNRVFTQNGIACTTTSLIAATASRASTTSPKPTCPRSATRTCCCARTTRGSRACSPCRAGISPGCSPWRPTRSPTSSHPETPGGSSAAHTTCSMWPPRRPDRRRGCHAPARSTGPSPRSSTTPSPSRRGSVRCSNCAGGTASPPRPRSTSPRSPTPGCSCWCTVSTRVIRRPRPRCR